MRGDYEEMEPETDEPFDWTWVLIILLFLALFVGSFFASGMVNAAEPPQVMLEPPQVMLARAEAKAPDPAPRVVIVPGRWEYGADGLWRFYPDPTPRGPVGTAADGRYGSEVAAPVPFAQAPTGGSTATTLAPFAGGPSSSSPAPVRGPVRIPTGVRLAIPGGTEPCLTGG